MCFCLRRKGRGENNGGEGKYRVTMGKRKRKKSCGASRGSQGGGGFTSCIGLRQPRINSSVIFANPSSLGKMKANGPKERSEALSHISSLHSLAIAILCIGIQILTCTNLCDYIHISHHNKSHHATPHRP